MGNKQSPTLDNNLAFIKVVISVPLEKEFEYSLPSIYVSKAIKGARVVVPFGRKKVMGIILSCSDSSEFESSKIKPIIQICDALPSLDKRMLSLGKWLSDFYLYPLGEVFTCMLPNKLLKVKSPANVSQSSSVSSEKINESELYFSNEMDTLTYIQTVSNPSADSLIKLSRSKKQKDLYQYLIAKQELEEVCSVTDIKQHFSMPVIKGLLDKKLAYVEELKATHSKWTSNLCIGQKKRANTEQAIAIASINQSNNFEVSLIEGVTGSGKTEVYLQVIEQILMAKKQVLILVPEIGLTPQTVKRFEDRFGKVVSVWHSGLSDTDRLTVWKEAKYDQAGIFIGTRSSIFLPLSNLGMIIVDEEHDESFKQQDSLRYHARDVAIFRAKQENVPLVLGTATPSLESLYNALNRKYKHLTLNIRAGSAAMPTQHLLDLRGVKLSAGIAPAMLQRMQQQLDRGNQVLIFVNRRGYAPALICNSCGNVESCIDCDNPFTVHLSSNNLQCHRCGKYESFKPYCHSCGSNNVTTQGVGTEQIQHLCESTFPNYSTIRIDSDAIKGKNKLQTLLNEINSNQHQILIGTQILSKGHHFPNVTLAMILNVDSFLFSSDYRAPEKLAQLVTQLGGRAGRADKAGEVWLQTHQIGNALIQDLVNNGYAHFARLLLEERLAANLPPKTYQIALRVEHEIQNELLTFMQFANSLFMQFKQLEFVGPFPAGIEKKQNRYRFISVTQSTSSPYLNKAFKQIKNELIKHKLASKVRWSIDVMPTEFS